MAPATATLPASPLLSAEQAAEYLGTTAGTLAVWRCTRRGPQIPYLKIGKSVRYRASDLERYLAAHTIGATEDQ
jgi:excisionase family DNA binding protein